MRDPSRPSPPITRAPALSSAIACLLLATAWAVHSVRASAHAADPGAKRPAAAGDPDTHAVDAGPEPSPAPHDVAPRADPAPALADPKADEAVAEPTTPTPAPATSPAPDASAGDAEPLEAAPAIDATAPREDARASRTDPASLPNPPDAPALPAPAPTRRTGFGFGGVPALNYDADNGFGFGVVGTLFWYDGETDPYRLAVTLQLFMTSLLVQDHNVVVDWLRAFGWPLRITSRIGYLQSLTQNYCGLGGDVSCDGSPGRERGRDLGLRGEQLDEAERRYTQRRFMSPYGLVNLRLSLFDAPRPRHERVDLLVGYRGLYFQPGDWFTDDDGDGAGDLFPYPNSLYARDFPDGEPGYLSAALVGVIYDTRDHEPAPTEGVYLESTARAASPFLGSAWQYAGLNVTLRTYVPLDPSHALVLAARTIGDAVIGDPPIQELARIGGTLDVYAFGGGDLGRGIRAQRYLGRLRLMHQSELRWRFARFEVLEQRFETVAAAFADGGITAASLETPGHMPLQAGFGGGLRVGWNEDFWIRFDLAASPVESYAPSLYVLVNNPF